MPFSNREVGGQGALVRPSIHSPNYVAGSTGWTINKDGTAEFSGATVRGDFQVGSGAGEIILSTTIPAELVAWGAAQTPVVTFLDVQIQHLSATTYAFRSVVQWPVIAFLFEGTYDPGNTVLLTSRLRITGGPQGNTLTFGGASGVVTPAIETIINFSNVDRQSNGVSLPRGFVDGVNVTTGTLVSAVSTETDISQMALTASVVNGRTYLITMQVRATVTVTTDDWDIRVRRDTAVTGTQLAVGQFSGFDLIGTPTFSWIYESAATETLLIFFSVARTAGTGTITLVGSPGAGIARTFAAIQDIGANANFRTA